MKLYLFIYTEDAFVTLTLCGDNGTNGDNGINSAIFNSRLH